MLKSLRQWEGLWMGGQGEGLALLKDPPEKKGSPGRLGQNLLLIE